MSDDDDGTMEGLDRDALEQRLREAEATLDAIRRGEVDAVVVQHPQGERIYTLETADRPYRVLVEHMQEGAVTLTTDGVVLYCNRRFAALLDVPRELLIGHSVAPYLPSADAEVLSALLTRDQQTGSAVEVSLRRGDGSSIPITISAVDLPAEQDMPRVICVIATDLTHSRQRSHELAAANARLASEIEQRRSAEDRLAVAMDAAGMGSWDIDPKHGTVRRSSRADAILGVTASTSMQADLLESLYQLFLEGEQEDVRVAFDQALVSGELDFERRIKSHRDVPDYRWVHMKGRVHYDDGSPARLIGIVTDVTERKLMELQLRQAQKMEAVGQLTGGIAHDFNNLLMVIGGSLEVLESLVPDDPKAKRFFAAARTGVERGATLNQQLLAFSRRQDLQTRVVCVHELLQNFEALLSRALGETVALELVPPAQPLYCQTDPHQLETAVLNLAINARDAMPEGGRLRISTTLRKIAGSEALTVAALPGSYVALRVQDSGTGMSPEIAARIFDPFFTTKATGKGTGLGLSQVYGFVQQSGGFVTVTSETGQGTTIELCLPHTDESPSSASDTEATRQKGEGLVLVVDDDDHVREVTVALLAGLGYTTLEASDAAQALVTLAGRADVDVVFSDVIMPGTLNGVDLAHRVQAAYPETAMILASGFTAQHQAIVGMPEKITLLRKPYTQAALSAAVNQARTKAGR